MSNTDNFIEEVTEEVRRDKLFALLRKYGWIGAVVVLVIVGGTAYSEFQKARMRAQAQAAGDQMLAAMALDESKDRAAALEAITLENPDARIILELMQGGELVNAQDTGKAGEVFQKIAQSGDVPAIYRQIAAFKALSISGLDANARRAGYEELAQTSSTMRILAQEQLALIDLEEGKEEAAVKRLQSLIEDSESTSNLQQRALQLMVALGHEPDLTQFNQP